MGLGDRLEGANLERLKNRNSFGSQLELSKGFSYLQTMGLSDRLEGANLEPSENRNSFGFKL